MEQNRQISNSPGEADRQIGSLLSRSTERGSVVDRLMDIPLPPAGSDAPEWDAAVIRRLEAKLADRMREIIDPEADDKSA